MSRNSLLITLYLCTLLSLSVKSVLSISDTVVQQTEVAPAASLAGNSCTFSHGTEYSWDPTGLSNYPISYSAGKLRFTMNFCSESPDSKCVSKNRDGKTIRGAACLYEDDNTVYSLGTHSDSPAPTYAVIDYGEPDYGIEVLYKNGGACAADKEEPYIMSIHLICDMTASTPSMEVEQYSDCYYFGQIRTKFGCNGYSEASKSAGGLSGGWIFIIIVLCSVGLYLGAGFAVCTKRYGKTGKNAIPHLDFWLSVKTNALVGLQLVIGKVRGMFGAKSITTTDGSTYETL